jgi:hypothetical protein
MINTRNSLRRGNLDKNEPFQVGLTIAKLLTSSWNSQQKPPKIHFFNRRIHHGEVGALLGLSILCTKYPSCKNSCRDRIWSDKR